MSRRQIRSGQDFFVKRYPQFQQYIQDKFEVDFNVSGHVFRHSYKNLYQYDTLQRLAYQGIVRHPHLHYWRRIARAGRDQVDDDITREALDSLIQSVKG